MLKILYLILFIYYKYIPLKYNKLINKMDMCIVRTSYGNERNCFDIYMKN